MLLSCKHAQFQLLMFRTHPPVGGWGVSTHVALFMRTIFHMILFQVEYYMSVRYKRVDIIKFPSIIQEAIVNMQHKSVCTHGGIDTLEQLAENYCVKS